MERAVFRGKGRTARAWNVRVDYARRVLRLFPMQRVSTTSAPGRPAERASHSTERRSFFGAVRDMLADGRMDVKPLITRQL